MSFIRPEVAQRLNHWREALAGGASAMLGAIWMTTEPGALQIIGTVLTIGGALLLFAGIQRARFRKGIGGAGVVQIDEARLTYFGPVDGGSLAVRDLTRLELDAASARTAHWVLTREGGEPLRIPVDATGAEALFDVFASLPGLETGALLAELERDTARSVTIWERAPSGSLALR